MGEEAGGGLEKGGGSGWDRNAEKAEEGEGE